MPPKKFTHKNDKKKAIPESVVQLKKLAGGGKLKKKKYLAAKCAFHNGEGKRCAHKAVGKSSLCKNHGGSRCIPENLPGNGGPPDIILDPNTKYDPAVHPIKYIQLSEEGHSPSEIAHLFNVVATTFPKWAEDYPMFGWAMERGNDAYEFYWLKMGKDNIQNSRNFNFPMFKYLTGNKIGYSEKIETKSMNQHMHGVLVIPATPATTEDWEEQAAKNIRQ